MSWDWLRFRAVPVPPLIHSLSVLRHTGNWCIYDNVSAWDIPKSIANFEKHGVPFEEAATVFGDAQGLDWDDVAHSHQEQRFKRLGLSVSERLFLVRMCHVIPVESFGIAEDCGCFLKQIGRAHV